VSALSEAEDALRGIADVIRAKADELTGSHLPVVHDAAQTLARLTSSRIVTEVMQYGEEHLPSSTVDAVVALIRDTGEAALRIASLTAPPPPAEGPVQP
jgi:hypothetical protein